MGLFGKRSTVRPQQQLQPPPEDSVTFAEFEAAVKEVGLQADWNGARLKHLFDVFDIDGNGFVERSEFEKTLGQLRTLSSKLEDPKPKDHHEACLLYTSPSPRDGLLSRMPSSA